MRAGRPRVDYRPRPLTARGGVRHYRVLAEALLGQLSTTTADPSAAATAAGHAWGAFLVRRPPPFTEASPDTAVSWLTTMLDELDFAPEPVADQDGRVDRIRLRHCPFLELAQPHRDLVCPLHLGLMRGALSELGASVTVSALKPFAEPTACVAHLTHSA
ncbi:transcriptional regulator [Mycolicibacterium sp.]|uniref:transcriptional regulator n=1 Tax=Mycolicibacterium sp. TaxID=2320850 RepID=UPI003D0B1A43